MQICFFEDNKSNNLQPLTLTRPVDDLRIGIYTIGQKWKRALAAPELNRLLRANLKTVFSAGSITKSKPCIWINSRYLPTKDLVSRITDLENGQCLKDGQTVIAACVDGENSVRWHQQNETNFNNLFVLQSSNFCSIDHLWDLFQQNGREIKNDLSSISKNKHPDASISDGAMFSNRDQIYISDGVTIEPGVVLNADSGPIYIGKNATIMAGALIRGPVAIGEESIIKMGAKIYKDTSIGPVCKVGGEISNTIFHSYSNKAHGGYIGNSVVGQWCNFGAGTTISNLKTNYSSIRITDWKSNQKIDSGQQFIGVIFGDHSKTAINSVINSGTICGVSCNLLSRDFPPRRINSFSWVRSNVIQPYKLEKALQTMERMMARREVTIIPEYRELMTSIHKQSQQS